MYTKNKTYILRFHQQNLFGAVLATFADIAFSIFVGIVFVTFVDTLSVAFLVSSHTITLRSRIKKGLLKKRGGGGEGSENSVKKNSWEWLE